jgi:hypothetical protein
MHSFQFLTAGCSQFGRLCAFFLICTGFAAVGAGASYYGLGGNNIASPFWIY